MKETTHLAHELLSDLAAKVALTASECLGADQNHAKALGNVVANKMAAEWGGQLIYVPKNIAGQRTDRNAQIFQEFTGNNVSDLARKYGLGIQAVYRIIKAERALRSES